jgi:hypothetical protein
MKNRLSLSVCFFYLCFPLKLQSVKQNDNKEKENVFETLIKEPFKGKKYSKEERDLKKIFQKMAKIKISKENILKEKTTNTNVTVLPNH